MKKAIALTLILVAITELATGQGFDFQSYELTLEGPDRVEAEPGAQVSVDLDVYLTAATHTVSGLDWWWYSNGFAGLRVTSQWSIDPGDVPIHVASTSGLVTVPADGSSFTTVWELRDARVEGPWGWVTSVVTNTKEITIAPINDSPTDTGHHGGDRYDPQADCAVCHGADLTGAPFGAVTAPSCYDCHGPVWNTLNEPPTVDAGVNQVIDWIDPSSPAYLDGTAYDPDDSPSPLVVEWSRASGPGTVTFDDDSSATTVAHFSVPGVYSLVLTADDGLTSVSDQVQITVGHTGTGPVVACNPVAHWSLDEGSGLLVRDSSGNGHDATLVGSPQWVDGPAGFGDALAFSRINYVEAPHEPDFDLTGEITVAAWANIEKIDAQWSPIVTKGNSAWRLSTRADQKRFHFAVTGPADGSNWVNGNIEVELGQWHHIAGTYDGAQIRLYIDGVEDRAGPVRYAGPVSKNDFPVWIGGNAQFPGSGFFGRIDAVCVYDCALDRDEIASLMGVSPAVGTMHIREVIDNGPISDQQACLASLDSGAGTIIDYSTSVLNILDSGVNGHFGNDDSFGVVAVGHRPASEVDNLSMEAGGVIRIPAGQGGEWTFGVNSDDGFTLYFPDRHFLTAVNGELVHSEDETALRYAGSRAALDTLGTIQLPAGEHPFRLTYHEALGGAGIEFFAAKGIHTQFDPDVFQLVGQPDIGAVAVPGLCGQITLVASYPGDWTGGAINNLQDARDALAHGQSRRTISSAKYDFVNHGDPDTGGSNSGYVPGDAAFPNNVQGRDDNDFAVKVTGQLDIPVTGTYQIGFNSDDGAYLKIDGKQWKSIVEDATGSAQIAGDELTNDSITGWSFTAGEIQLETGCHSFEAVMFERGGGAFFELFGRGVSEQGLADASWHLLRTGGAKLAAPSDALQLAPLK